MRQAWSRRPAGTDDPRAQRHTGEDLAANPSTCEGLGVRHRTGEDLAPSPSSNGERRGAGLVAHARHIRALALAIGTAFACTACGSADATHARLADSATSRPSGPSTTTPITGGSSTAPSSGASSATPADGPPLSAAECAPTVAATLGTVAKRIYHEAAAGSIAGEAVHRVQSSSALAAAVNGGDAGTARSVLKGLLAGQIVRIEILRGGHPFASAGSGSAIAPVEGPLPGAPGARFRLSVQADLTYLQVTRQVTGAQVLLLAGDHRLGGTFAGPSTAELTDDGALAYQGQSYQSVSLTGSVYPAGPLRIVLLVPSAGLSCPGSAAQTRVETLGRVGEHIYEEEQSSPYVKATVRRMESTAAFRRAVAAHDVNATRAAIIGFFAAHIHVVRVRVTVSSRLLIDLGGPHVLAPVHGTLRQGSAVIGHFTMAIQDDAGYLRLAHLFTGADILMRTGSGQAAGTLEPGPASVPARGSISYRGSDYEAYSFTGEAFPSGPLRISLLIRR